MSGEWVEWRDLRLEQPFDKQICLTYSPEENLQYRLITFGVTSNGFPAMVTHWMPLPEPPND